MTKNNDIEPLLHTLSEAAHALRLGLSTVRALAASGELKTIKIGDRRLVTRQTLVDFVSSRAAA